MFSLGALAFATPWALAALAALPVLWWLLRITPPQPRQVTFPPLRLLLLLRQKEETPAHTPLWLLILRLLIAALAIMALAEPILNPQQAQRSGDALVLVIDDGWTAAPRWREKLARAGDVLEVAERDGRPALLITTAAPANGEAMQPGQLMPAADLRPVVAALQPKPWPSDRAALVQALLQSRMPEAADVVWLADAVRDDESGEAAYTLAEWLRRVGPLSVIAPGPNDGPLALLPPATTAQGDMVTVRRSTGASGDLALTLRAVTDQGRVLAREPIAFAGSNDAATVKLDLPTELRNQLGRLEIEQQPSAGSVQLLDDRWRRRPVGLVSGGAVETRQPLLGDLFYLERALTPFAELRNASIAELLQREIAIIILADVAQVVSSESRQLDDWIDKGGVLLRFAGPRMAEANDSLLPVRLRQGARQLGGALSWSQPQRLGATPETSPFYGLFGGTEVTVSRQVLAEPEPQLGDKTWLRLEDGTPLVTAMQRGKGWLILVHTSANALWSDLALSGFYVDMLRKVIDLSQGVATIGETADAPLPPLSMLDGFGRSIEPGPAVQPLPARSLATTKPNPRHPPGWYGRLDSRQALNAVATETVLRPIDRWPSGITQISLENTVREIHLLPWLLGVALLLFLADWLIGLGLRGLLPRLRRPATAAVAVLGLLLVAGAAQAQQQRRTLSAGDEFALKAALELRLAYVVTGQADVDQMSRSGLYGLTEVLYRRTSIEASEPLGVNLEADDISLVPFLYWPITTQQPQLSDRAIRRLDQYMKTGGMILFDTRDQAMGLSGTAASPNTEKLRQMLARLDIPPLMPVPDDHVLTKAFYLLQDFPGRYTGGTLWVERNPGGDKDGVTSIVIGSHDFAAAWAMDQNGRPLAVTVPNIPRQREYSYRFGVNLLIYTLTGNYKADQVHVPALLERLGN